MLDLVSYPPRLAEILNQFGSLATEDGRVELLLSYAEQFHEVPPHVAVRPFPEGHRVRFCESEAYVWSVEQPDHTLEFYFAVENPSGVSAKALAAILEKGLSGATPAQVAQVSEDIVYHVFRQNISMGKGMGLMSMVQTVRAIARQLHEGNHATGSGGRSATLAEPSSE